MIRHRDSFPARLVLAAVATGVSLFATRPADAAPATSTEVMVWPRRPDTPLEGVDEAARAAGRRSRAFASVRARLGGEDAAAQAELRAALARVEAGLEAARAAYLAQRADEMLGALERAEAEAVAALPPGPLCSATLWEVEFQLGLAYGARKGPGDRERAAARFALAWVLDGERRPAAALYGPDVGLAFVQAVDAAGRRPARPVRVEVTPRDARVAVDCRPLAADAGLRPGLHVVRVDAPGYGADARVVEDAAALTAALARAPDEPLGAWWAGDALDPSSASARDAVQRAAGVAEVVWLEAAEGHFVARLVVDGQVRGVARADTGPEAVRQALARREVVVTPPASARPRRRTGLWVGLASAALGGAALGLGLGLGLREPDARLQLVVRP